MAGPLRGGRGVKGRAIEEKGPDIKRRTFFAASLRLTCIFTGYVSIPWNLGPNPLIVGTSDR